MTNVIVEATVVTQSDQAWLDHCAEMSRLHMVKSAELVTNGWQQVGRARQGRFTRDGVTVELRRQLGSAVWYTVTV